MLGQEVRAAAVHRRESVTVVDHVQHRSLHAPVHRNFHGPGGVLRYGGGELAEDQLGSL